jgi:hypothetical protein
MLTTTMSRILRRHASRASGLHPPVLPVSSTACRRTLFAAAFSRVDVTVRPTLAPRLRRAASGLAAAAREALAAERVRAARIPSSEDLDEAELDAELLPASEITLRMSDRAAEVRCEPLLPVLLRAEHACFSQRLRAIAAREGSGAALRIGVESGGCHGYQYTMELADAGAAAPED